MDVFLNWSSAQVSSFVESILPENERYLASLFRDNAIDGSLLPYITIQHLHEMGISSLKTRLIIKKAFSEIIIGNYNSIDINTPISLQSLQLATTLLKDMLRKLELIKESPDSPLSSSSDMKRLQSEVSKIKSELIPIIRLIKDKPLPLDPKSVESNKRWSIDPTNSADDLHYKKRSPLDSSNTEELRVKKSWNTDSEPLDDPPSPSSIFSNRFSSGSLLSMGTGKIIQQSVSTSRSSDLKLSSVPKSSDYNLASSARSSSDFKSSSITPRISSAPKSDTNASSSILDDYNQRPKIAETKSLTRLVDDMKLKPPVLKQSLTTNSIKTTNSHNLFNHQKNPQLEPLKQLRASSDDSCLKVLQQAMKRYKIPRNNWSKYVLVICYGNKERILKLAEKPVSIVKELNELGKHPTIMLRQLAEVTEEVGRYEDSRIVDDIPGGTL